VGVDQHNIAFGVALLCQNRCPKAGVSTADDAEIARVVVHQHGVGIWLVNVVQPIRIGFGVRDCVQKTLVLLIPTHGFPTT